MKKIKLLKLLALLVVLLTSIYSAWATDYFFRHWDADNNTHLIDRGSNVHSSYFILSSGSISFKISDGSWTDGNTWGLNTGSISLNSEYTCVSTGNNFSWTVPSNRAYFVRFNSSSHKLLISTFVPSAAAPSNVVSGTNVMFYIKGNEGLNYLINSSKEYASTTTPMNYMGYSYVNTAKTNLSTYDRISNNPGGWTGDENTNIKSATGGELFDKNKSYDIAKKTASTTASVTGETLSISTTTSATTGVYGSLPLYIQYYIDGTFAGVTYSSSTASYGSIPAGGATARASTYNVSGLSNGSHTLKTVLTDGIIYWVVDADGNGTPGDETFNVAHTYTITYKDKGGGDYSGSNSLSLPGTYTYGTGVASLTAGVKSGYVFDGWFEELDCSGSAVTSISSSAEGNKTLYAKFTQIGITLTAGTGGKVSKDNSNWEDEVTITGISFNTAYNIYAQASTGYTFSGWTKGTNSSNTTINTASTPNTVSVSSGSVTTITAGFSERMSSLSTSCSYDAGTPGYAAPTVSSSATDVGYVTTRTITATAAGTGYTFAGWTLTNCTRTDGGEDDDTEITIRSNGDGAAATVVANYAEDLTSTYYLVGNNLDVFPGDATWAASDSKNMLRKASGSSTDNVGSITIDVKTIPANNSDYQFKIHESTANKWWGWGKDASYYWMNGTKTTGLYNNEHNLYFIPNALGDYTFTTDWSDADVPSLTVTFPATTYTVSFSKGTVDGSNGSVSATYSSTSFATGTKVQSGKTVRLTAPAAKEGYTYRGWYSTNTVDEENLEDNRYTDQANYDVTISSAVTAYACYTLNNHDIDYTAPSNGSYTIKVGSAEAVSEDTNADYGTTITLAASPSTGYHFGSWSVTKSPSGSVTVTSNQFAMPDANVTVAATFVANDYTITLTNHDATTAGTTSVSVTYDATTGLTSDITCPEKTGYTFGGYYTEEEGSGTQLIDKDGKWQKNNAWINSSGEWVNAGDEELHAKWTANNYTVSFNVNGGTASTPDSKEVTYDAAYGELPGGMTHDSKQFIGWYTDPDDGEGDLITAETTVSTASNHTLYAHYESVYSVNVDFKCGDAKVYPSTSVEASPTSLTPTITAPEIFGYTFVNWTGTNVTPASATSATTTITATAATTITANYNIVPTVYFKNNLGWDSVFVSFDITWTSVDGKQVPNNSGKPYFAMTQIGSSDVYYCEIPSTYTASNYASWSANIAFDNKNYNYKATADAHTGNMTSFYQGEFTGRGDFDPKATLFIPYNGDTEARNSGTFYQSGCWMKYNSTESGYQVNMNTLVTGTNDDTLTVKLTAANAGGYEFSAKLNLTHPNYTYGFKLYKDYQKSSNDIWYTNCPATIGAATDDLPWPFWAGTSVTATSDRCGLHTESLGDYTITVSFATGKPMVNVEYPTLVGDWRLAYNDRVAWSGSAHDASWYLYSRVIKKAKSTGAEDIVSFYVSKKTGASASIELQQCTAINASTGAETWTKQGDNLDLSSITKTGYYNFKVTQNGSGEVTSVTNIGAYEGNFYIRTDASDGGWNNYISSGKNVMTYSEYAAENSGFTHYFMRYVTKGSNIKFCIANDYSECLTEYCISDNYTNEYIEADGNVRFMWDSAANVVSRAYISGSSKVSDRFLVLEGSAKMYDKDGNALSISGLNANEINFFDDQNWIYEATIKAKPGAKALLTAKYNTKIQYLGGSGPTNTDSVQLLGGSDTEKYKIRVVYDFKTNRLIKAFIPDGAINSDLSINADMMIIREHQGDAQQITFGEDGKLSQVKTVYGAMKFNKYTVNGKEKTGGHAATGASRFERDLFYISFPFDVKLNEAFGFGTYGQHWIIEYYDGKGRAANGYWADSESNWKFVMPAQRKDFIMKAFEGYILALDLDEMSESSSIWNNGVEDVYVYFPSSAEVDDIEATNRRIFIDQTGYKCNIGPRFSGGDDRTTKDSYWHCIGVPSFANYSSTLYDGENSGTRHTIDWTNSSMPYLYEWRPATNGLMVTESSTFSFKATWSYMVQYAGDSIYWSTVNVTPAASVAARLADTPDREYKLVLQSEEQTEDQTFVRMTDDANVTTGFEFNYDLSKEMNKNRANIYTLISTTIDSVPSITEAAANVQPHPLTTTIVPVGVKIAANGEYTFSMPEGTNGGDVWLIDNANSSRTNLGLMDYTVNLTTGTYEGRFSLEFPVQNVVTEIENAANANANANADVRKVFVGGRLYILRDGKAYDATGAQVR